MGSDGKVAVCHASLNSGLVLLQDAILFITLKRVWGMRASTCNDRVC